ncbi:MAG: ADP-glyceromanno-heptose 6-epimerase [Puniceicoccales bacterium]|jgi:ADP-L-glycero-D-manno-heptose 6-epimerase|nr:ADP-glyceromanno-heptose 6-epimerase [Puniceicoccales bacterium]
MKLTEAGTILVTGGAGFIGSALINELNNRGFENIIVSDFLGSDNKFLNLVPLRFNDYIEADTMLDMIEKKDPKLNAITHIFHLGACSSTTEKNAAYLIKNNYEYTKALANFAHGRHVRFVYASSAATYGDGSRGMSDQIFPNTDLRPLNAYGYSKHLFDLYAARNNLHVHGMKYFNVFGPNEYHKGTMRSMVLKAYESILANGKVYLFKSDRQEFKDGEQRRDFLYVKDAVAMTIFLAEIPEAVNGKPTHGIYNLGSGVASTWKELAFAIFEAMGKEAHIEFIDMPGELKDKYQYHTCADISKLHSLGYDQPITPLKAAVKDYVQNYLMEGMKILNY